MEILWFLVFAFICVVLVSQVVLWNFMELRNKRPKDDNDANIASPSSTEETQLPSSLANDTNATPPPPRSKRKKKDDSTKSIPSCRFCKQVFTSPQALGGHMNRHRGEREKEEFQKAEILVHAKGQNFALGYPSGSVGPSYYQPEDNCGNQYQGGGGAQITNAASMMGNMGGGLQRQVYQNSNQQQFVGASQTNPNYGPAHHLQSATQANIFQTQPQHGGSYPVNYKNHYDNAPRPPHIPSGVPLTSYTPRANSGQYPFQGTGSLRDVRPYAMPHGGSTTGLAHHQNNIGFSTSHNLSPNDVGETNMPTIDTATLETPIRSNSTNVGLRQSSTANQAVTQFVDQSGNVVIQGPSSGLYSTGLRPLNPSHFHDNVQATTKIYDQESLQDRYTNQVSYAGTSIQYNNVGVENQYHAPGAGMLNFEDAHEEDEFGSGGPDPSTMVVTEFGHSGGGSSTGRSVDARSHLRN